MTTHSQKSILVSFDSTCFLLTQQAKPFSSGVSYALVTGMMMDAARQVVRAHENGSTRCLGKKIGSYQSKVAGHRKGGLRLLVQGWWVMKILIAASFFFFLNLPINIFCQEKFEAPKLTIGSFWKFGYDKKKEYTSRIISIRDDGYLIRTGKIYGIYSKETLNRLFAADKEGNKIEEDLSIYRKMLNFPLFVGKTWVDSMDRLPGVAKSTTIVSYKVEGYEEVVTPAGSLRAFRVLMKDTTIRLDINRKSFGEAKFWVSPEAKWWIKRDFYAGRWAARSAILLKYHLNK